jgi:type III pantothenate kinase
MQSGAYHGLIAEIEQSIQQLKTQFSDLQVILCGGNAELLSKQLKSPLFVEKNLLMYGLHLILDLNV